MTAKLNYSLDTHKLRRLVGDMQDGMKTKNPDFVFISLDTKSSLPDCSPYVRYLMEQNLIISNFHF